MISSRSWFTEVLPGLYIAWFVDGMVYTRGSRDDWDRWAEVTDEGALSWDNMLPFMFRVREFPVIDIKHLPNSIHVGGELDERLREPVRRGTHRPNRPQSGWQSLCNGTLYRSSVQRYVDPNDEGAGRRIHVQVGYERRKAHWSR